VDSRHELRHVATRVHGRYLLRAPLTAGPWPLLVGFHGYAETADAQLDALSHISGADTWLIVSVQALHSFYTRDRRVVANWMTRQDRELAIADNLAYVSAVLEAVRSECSVRPPLVFAGFSQGAAMAYRAAAHAPCRAVIVLGGDVPPDVADAARLPRVLIGRGTNDAWYTAEKHERDCAALAALAVPVETCVFDGGHEWTDKFYEAAGRLLAEVRD
jgi:predicted esterase